MPRHLYVVIFAVLANLSCEQGDIVATQLEPSDDQAETAPPITLRGSDGQPLSDPVVQGGATQTLIWVKTEEHPEVVFIEMSRDGGETWEVVTQESMTNTGSYDFQVPNQEGLTFQVRVVEEPNDDNTLAQTPEITIEAEPPELLLEASDGALSGSELSGALMIDSQETSTIDLSELVQDDSALTYTVWGRNRARY